MTVKHKGHFPFRDLGTRLPLQPGGKGSGVPNEDQPAEINFEYIKSTQFRVVHVDGVSGSITPGRLIHAAVFNERPAIPQRTFQRINPDGTLGSVIDEKTVSRGGIVRELEVDMVMSAEAARTLASWLLQRVSELERLEDILEGRKTNVRDGN